jgi:hypothetical protein
MELGEAVAVDVSNTNHDKDCYFCNAKDQPVENENDLTDDPDDDAEGYGSFKNDASKLGKALGGDPGTRSIKVDDSAYDVSTAAHHLIPGNASLKKSSLFKSNEYLWVDKKAKGNIGYNVNSSANGVWLPGNYAIRPWSPKADDFKKDYSFRAISKWGAQFHDAHEEYSSFVLQVLEEVFEKLELGSTVWCEEGKSEKDKSPSERKPLYAIVARLNTISGRMRRMVVFPTRSWKKNVYTSTRTTLFMAESKHRSRAS